MQYPACQQPAAAPGAFHLAAVEPIAAQAEAIATLPGAPLVQNRFGVGVTPTVRSARVWGRATERAERVRQLGCDGIHIQLHMRFTPFRACMQQPGLRAAALRLAAVARDPAKRAFVYESGIERQFVPGMETQH